ncbi:MAG: GTP-sensing pleiotropic transcriptional regulator CodY, partial [Urechidicola sp.]
MKNTIFRKSLILIGFFSVLSVNAQQKKNTNKIAQVISQNINIPDHRTCGLNKHEEALINDAEYAKSFFERQVIFKQKLTEIHQQKVNGAYRRMATLYIPVAVHFPEANES